MDFSGGGASLDAEASAKQGQKRSQIRTLLPTALELSNLLELSKLLELSNPTPILLDISTSIRKLFIFLHRKC